MRVVHVVRGLAWIGGIQEYVSGVSRGMARLGHDVVILSGGSPPAAGSMPHEVSPDIDIRWHPHHEVFGRYRVPDGMMTSLRQVGRWADVVHVHQGFYVGTWMALSTKANLRVGSLYLHPDHVPRPRTRKRVQLELLLRRLDGVVAVSGAELDLIKGVREPRRGGVAWPGLVPTGTSAHATVREPRVISVSRITDLKGFDLLLRTLSLLPRSIGIDIVGDGPAMDKYRQLCTDLGMDADRLFHGSLPESEVNRLLNRARVFVSASGQESFGISTLKAIAHGCTPIISDIPSHREMLSTLGIDARFLFDLSIEPTDLAERLRSALDEEPPSQASRSRVPTWTDTATTVIDHYERFLAG